MGIKKEIFKTSTRIIRYLANKEKEIAYYEDLVNNLESNISTKRRRKTFSDSLNLLEKFGLVQEVGTDAYKLLK